MVEWKSKHRAEGHTGGPQPDCDLLSELYYGAYKSQKVQKNLNSIKTLEDRLLRIDSNREICKTFGQLKSELEKGGNIIDDADLFIACSALTANLVLVTNNERHFSRIKGLKIENWSKAE